MAPTKKAGKAGMTGMIRARIDPDLKAKAEAIMGRLGLSASDVIRLLYKQITLTKGLPFDVRIPNAATRKALKDAEAGKNLIRYESFDDFAEAMTGE